LDPGITSTWDSNKALSKLNEKLVREKEREKISKKEILKMLRWQRRRKQIRK